MPKNIAHSFSFFQSVHKIPHLHWNDLVSEQQVYLKLSYLKALEETLKRYSEEYLCLDL